MKIKRKTVKTVLDLAYFVTIAVSMAGLLSSLGVLMVIEVLKHFGL